MAVKMTEAQKNAINKINEKEIKKDDKPLTEEEKVKLQAVLKGLKL